MTPTRTATLSRARPGGRGGAAKGSGQRLALPGHSERTVVHVLGRSLPISTMLFVVVALLCVIGLTMVGTASSVISINTYGSPWAILIRESMWMAIGAAALGVIVRFDYHKLRRLSPVILIGTMGLLLVVLVPGIGLHVEGSSRWIGFGQFRIQPSEVMKLALTLFAADFITRRLDEDASDRRIMGPLLLVTAGAGVLILAQPDMGTAMVLAAIALTLLFVSGVRLGPVFKLLGALAALALIVAVASPYRRARLLSFLDPSSHSSSSGYQVVQSLIGLGSGHLFGAGLGGGQQQWGFLPNAHTDFIFSVIGEELGIVGAVAVLLLLGTFIWLGLRTATSARDRFGGLLALGLVAWIAAETLINVGAVLGVLPVTGIPLPFISFGGSSLVITMVAAGVLINIARQNDAAHGSGALASASASASASESASRRGGRGRQRGKTAASGAGRGRGRGRGR